MIIIKDINGIASEEEQALLNEAISCDPEVWKLQTEIKQKIKREDFSSYTSTHSNDEQFAKLMSHVQYRRKRRIAGWIVFILLIVVGSIAFTYYW